MASVLLKGKVISIAGIVYHDSRPLSHDSLRDQITDAGGEWSSTVGDRCTHLVATPKEYEKRSRKVQQAEQIQGLKTIHPDWLLASLEKNKLEDDNQYLYSKPPATNANGKRPGSPVSINSVVATKAQKKPAPSKSSKHAQIGPATTKKIPADSTCPYNASHSVHVSEDGTIYDASLNLSLASSNANKYYVIQVLHDVHTGESIVLWQRWGRVGEKGQSRHTTFGNDSAQAIKKFQQVFRQKTGLKWEDRLSDPRPGSYFFVEKSYEDSDDDGEEGNMDKGAIEGKKQKSEKQDQPALEPPQSQLHPHVQFLMGFIFNHDFFRDTMASMSYDANKLPLGKLSKRMLLSGFELLKRLAETIANEPNPQQSQQCAALSNQYFTTIPHVFGRRKPPIIAYPNVLKKETELLESLSEMEIASEIMRIASRGGDQEEHILDLQYKGLNLDELTSLASGSTEYTELEKYLQGSGGPTHGIQYQPKHIFRVSRAGEEERYNNSPFANRPESHRLLLWHGSRATNYGGILSQGLRIAPPEAPSTGYMFGKGVYFADCSTKSARYCNSSMSDSHGILLLCEVDVGPLTMYEATISDPSAAEHCKKTGKTTTLGKGQCIPRKWKDAECLDKKLKHVYMPDCTSQDGGLVDSKEDTCVQYNEYIVYDVRQVRVRYLVLTKIRGC